MSATIIDGKAVARAVRERVAQEVTELPDIPGLATVLVGDDPASGVYVGNKRKLCVQTGMRDLHQHLPADISQHKLAGVIEELNADAQVTGILLQLPLPPHLDAAALTARIDPDKDVDGLTTMNAGRLAHGTGGLRPCTPSGVIELLDAYHIPVAGANAVVVGRSDLVGKPLAQLLLQRDATVTICHSRTRDLKGICSKADILVAAAGVPQLINAAAIRPGSTVIDVGIHRTEAGLRGDVEFAEARAIAGAITPVPGGVGPMTIAMLLQNTVTAAAARRARLRATSFAS